jgi:hypothetical protein
MDNRIYRIKHLGIILFILFIHVDTLQKAPVRREYGINRRAWREDSGHRGTVLDVHLHGRPQTALMQSGKSGYISSKTSMPKRSRRPRARVEAT